MGSSVRSRSDAIEMPAERRRQAGATHLAVRPQCTFPCFSCTFTVQLAVPGEHGGLLCFLPFILPQLLATQQPTHFLRFRMQGPFPPHLCIILFPWHP